MSLYAQVTLLTAGADPADNQVGGFAVDAVGITTDDLDDWTVAIKDFYDDCLATGCCRGLTQNGHLVKVYDILGTAPNYPIYENTFNLGTAPGTVQLPMEVSLCVSYKNTVNNSVPRARRRGRLYLSGWAEAANATGRPTSTVFTNLSGSYANYVAAVNIITSLSAGVWSRADQVVYPIDEIWVDNEWDTVRRRGTKATTRTTVPV